MARQNPRAKTIRPNSLALAVIFLAAGGLAPSLKAQHVGVYDWEGAVDSLPHAESQLARFSFDTLRIFLGGKYDYVHPEKSPQRFDDAAKPVTLAGIAALPRYRALFEDGRLQTVWLTAYPVFDYGSGPVEIDLTRPVLNAQLRDEETQMADLVEWLYREYGSRNRTVLISNNETEEKMRELGSDPATADRVIQDLTARMNGVVKARARFPDAKLRVLCGVEIKYWRLALPDGRRALDSVLPQLHYDFVSFSAWELAEHPEMLSAALDDLNRRTASNLTAEGRAAFGDHHVLLGEFGHAREWRIPPEPFIKAGLDAVASGRSPVAVYWQLYDNTVGNPRQFGLLDPNDHLTLEGEAMRKLHP